MSQTKMEFGRDARSRGNWALWIALAVTLIILPFLSNSNYFLYSLATMVVFAYTGVAWDLLGGSAGQLSLGHSVYFGVGAYASILLAQHLGFSPWLSMPIAGLLAASIAFLFFFPTFRFGLVGPFFTLTTIGVAVIFELFVSNFDAVGGASGLMPPMKETGLYWLQYFDQRSYYFVGLGMLAAIMLISQRVRNSKLGYQLAALRGDESAAEACGVNVGLRKMQITALSAGLTAIGGVLYAQILTFVGPAIFGVNMAVAIAVGPIIGGSGRLLGPLVGAALLMVINETIQLYVGAKVPGLNLFVYGVMLIFVVLLMPEGIVPRIAQLIGKLRHSGGGAVTPVNVASEERGVVK
ncbi:MAG: branched-chain amino acid ABC transporter permease [Polaromonas sp.]|nr:branched-chain amino acid ABC transporter permease [Polaromonas sp.]